MPAPIHVIINPTAAGGKAARLEQQIIDEISRRFGPDFTRCITSRPHEATESTRAAIERAAMLVIAVGGDGTIQEVANGFLTQRRLLNTECELGIVNCGTGHGLAQSLALPRSIEEQLDVIQQGRAAAMDLGLARYAMPGGSQEERVFVNECQVGLGSAVVKAVGRGRKRLGGALAFGSAAVSELLRFQSPPMEVRVNGGSALRNRYLMVMAGNGSTCAGGMRLTPGATLDDGMLDVLLVRDMKTLARLGAFPRIYRGAHMSLRSVSSLRTCRLLVNAEVPIPVEADGELLGQTPCEMTVLPAAIRIRVPAETPK